jgi:hypothetical protein
MVTRTLQSDHSNKGGQVTSDDFMSLVREQAKPGLSQASLEYAAREYRLKGTMSKADAIQCMKLATWLEGFWTFRLEEESKAVESPPNEDDAPEPTQVLTSDDLVHGLKPWAESFRQENFHRTDAPCPSSREAAAAWIQDKANRRQVSGEEHAQLSQIDHDLRALHHEWRARTGVEWRDDGGHESLAYQDGEGGVKTISLAGPDPRDEHPTMPSQELIELQRAVEHMYDTTKFYKDSLVTYILTGIQPTLPGFKVTQSITHHWMTDLSRLQVTLDFLAGDVKDTEIRQAYGQYRKKFSTTRKKRLSPQHAEFLALVKRHRPIPRGRGSNAKVFWENIRLEHHKKQGRNIWKDAWTVRRYYNRLITPAQKKRN